MPEKNLQPEKRKGSFLLKKNIADILVATHTHEPYIIAFRYSGENVAVETLGTLTGFFEIEIHDEDAAYIVNFLASVAKKEYFANVRRDPVESFEAALHRINIALSELVKHGNITWLGHLNGALAVLVKNELHFSVTGEGALYLLRDHTFRSISEGLSEKEAEPHPLKTFVEVAGGELFPHDRIFLLSPSVWTLFTPVDIERGSARFGPEALEQFLRTALVNELDSASVILISCEEDTTPLPSPEKEEVPEKEDRTANAFSQIAFHKEKSPPRPETPVPKKESEFIDAKTGHIYIQGEDMETDGASPWKGRLALFLEKSILAWSFFLQRAGRSLRRFRKNFSLGSHFFAERMFGSLRSLGRKFRSLRRRLQESQKVETSPLPSKVKEVPPPRIREEAPSSLETTLPTEETWKKAFFTVCGKLFSWGKRGSILLFSLGKRGGTKILILWKSFSSRTKIISSSLILLLLIVLSWFFFSRSHTVPLPPPQTSHEENTPLSPVASIPLLLGGETLITFSEGTLLGLVFLNNAPWGISDTALYDLSSGEHLATPEKIAHAASMDDLHTLFLWSESGKLLAFTPANKKFVENTLPLPAGTTVESLATYLTYLYVLDGAQGKIYRFPRAEGGFGPATSWLKEGVPLPAQPVLSVNDIVVIGGENHVMSFFRGKTAVTNFTLPEGTPHISDITVTPEENTIYALDQNGKRLLQWESNGSLKRELNIASLPNASRLAVSADQKTLLVGSDEKILRFPLP